MKYLSALLLVVLALGCDDPASDDGSKADAGSKKPQKPAQDSSSSGDESNGEVKRDAGRASGTTTSGQPGKADASTNTPTNTPTNAKDGGAKPADPKDPAVKPADGKDAGVTPPTVGVPDGGVATGSGSCCSEHETPGCSNADLMVCVCEKDPSCCTKAWGRQCAFIVEQKFCQPGIRDCVCGSADGQWGQASCCETDWSSTCDSVAKLKCDAVSGCF
jgi:hypothetical protein